VDTIDQYLAQLDYRLDGPGRWRRRVLAETADGLNSAASTMVRDGGNDRREAERRAITGWGCPVALAAEFNALAQGVHGRRVARRILVMVPALVATWFAVLRFGPGIRWQPEPALLEVGPVALGVGVLAMVTSALVIILAQRRWAAGSGGPVCRAAVLLACAGTVTAVTAVVVLVCVRATVAPSTVSWPLYAGPLAATLGLLVLTGLDATAVARLARTR
jgi:hypothetical protein